MYRSLLKNTNEWNQCYSHMKAMSYTISTESFSLDPLYFPCLLIWMERDSDSPYGDKSAIQYDFIYPDEFE